MKFAFLFCLRNLWNLRNLKPWTVFPCYFSVSFIDKLIAGLPYLSLVTFASPPRTSALISRLSLASLKERTAATDIASLASSWFFIPAKAILIRLLSSIVISGSVTPSMSTLFNIDLYLY